MAINTNVTPEFLTKEVRNGIKRPGLMHTPYFEQMPTYEKAGCEIVYPDVEYDSIAGDSSGGSQRLNCQIVFGRDRSSHLLSGYGKAGGQPCASIDIVAGRMSALNKKTGLIKKKLEPLKRDTLVGNNFFADASRIYISQKCDIDHYFGLPPGDFGRPQGEAGIGIKSDHVRVIGRNSVKIYAGAGRGENFGIKGELDSNGEKLIDARIELIANSNSEPHPIVLGSNLSEFLEELLDQVAKLSEAFMLQNINMIKLQAAVATHFHVGGGAGVVVVGPDPVLATIALNEIPTNVQKITDNITQALNFQIMKVNYLGLPNSDDPKYRLKTKKNILSRNVFTT
jgi:hypothetical protein